MQTDQLQQLFALFKDLQDKIENGEILVQDDMIEREMHAKNAAQCQWENQQLDLQLYNLRKVISTKAKDL